MVANDSNLKFDTNGVHEGNGQSSEPSSHDEPYTVLEQWHSNKAPLRVIHVGAGAAGLLVAYKMQEKMTNYELVCYEK